MATNQITAEKSINEEIILNLGHFECGANKEVFELVEKAQDLLVKADVLHQKDVQHTHEVLNYKIDATKTPKENIKEIEAIKAELEQRNAKARLISEAKQHIHDMTPMLSLGIDVFDTNEHIIIRA